MKSSKAKPIIRSLTWLDANVTSPLLGEVSAIGTRLIDGDDRGFRLQTFRTSSPELSFIGESLNDLLRETFPGVPMREESILPYYAALMHRDEEWKDKLFLSIVASASRVTINAINTGTETDITKIVLFRGNVFVLDPASLHSSLPTTRRGTTNVLIQGVVDKAWVIKNRPACLESIFVKT